MECTLETPKQSICQQKVSTQLVLGVVYKKKDLDTNHLCTKTICLSMNHLSTNETVDLVASKDPSKNLKFHRSKTD